MPGTFKVMVVNRFVSSKAGSLICYFLLFSFFHYLRTYVYGPPVSDKVLKWTEYSTAINVSLSFRIPGKVCSHQLIQYFLPINTFCGISLSETIIFPHAWNFPIPEKHPPSEVGSVFTANKHILWYKSPRLSLILEHQSPTWFIDEFTCNNIPRQLIKLARLSTAIHHIYRVYWTLCILSLVHSDPHDLAEILSRVKLRRDVLHVRKLPVTWG